MKRRGLVHCSLPTLALKLFHPQYAREYARVIKKKQNQSAERVDMVLVGLDTDQVKSYVFATARLKEIRGASSILDELNEIEIPKVVTEIAGDHRVVYAGGGSALAEVENGDEARRLIQEVERLYRSRTKSAEITGDWIEMTDLNTSFGKYARRLNFSLRRRKGEKVRQRTWLASPVLKACQSCGQYPASRHVTQPQEAFICASCDIKRSRSEQIRNSSFGSRLQQLLEHARDRGQWQGLTVLNNAPDDFEEIGKSASPEGYIGFIYCDGNRMGELFSELDRDPYRKLSEGLRKTLREATFDALCQHFQELEPKQKFPFEIIFIGGDDLVLVVAADKALEIALYLCREFEERTKPVLELAGLANQRRRLSLSAAVVLSHASLPIYHLQTIADDLLKSAKRRSQSIRESHEETGCIDFHLVTASASELPSLMRRADWVHHETGKTLSLTERPYTAEEMAVLISHIRALQATNFPTSKLQMLYESVVERSMTQSIFTWAFVAGRAKRSKEPSQNQFTKLMAFFDLKRADWKWPWRESELGRFSIPLADKAELYATPVIDVAELYEFVRLRKKRS